MPQAAEGKFSASCSGKDRPTPALLFRFALGELGKLPVVAGDGLAVLRWIVLPLGVLHLLGHLLGKETPALENLLLVAQRSGSGRRGLRELLAVVGDFAALLGIAALLLFLFLLLLGELLLVFLSLLFGPGLLLLR